MFSPILPIRPFLTSSTVGPKPSWLSGSAESAATSAGFLAATSADSAFAKARKESFLVTKSVSQFTSIKAPVVPSTVAATTPSAAIRDAALPALLPSLTRSSSSALSMSPSASVSAFLHSIIGASVLARSAPTMLAVIAAIVLLLQPRRAVEDGKPGSLLSCEKGAESAPGSARRGGEPERRSGRGFVDFDELVADGSALHHFVGGVGLAFEDRVGDRLGVQRDRLRRVVVAGDDVVDPDRRVVRVDDGDDRDAELLRLGDRDLVEAHVDDEERVGQRVHVLDATDVLLELGELALEHQRFLLDADLGAGLDLRLHVLEPLQRALHGLEVGQHAAKPALVDERHAAAPGLLRDHLARLALGADHQDRAAPRRELADELHRVLEERLRLLEVDDVDLVAMAVDVRGHLGVPEARLVSEMDAGFQHFTHRDRHELPKVGSRIRLESRAFGLSTLPCDTLKEPVRG